MGGKFKIKKQQPIASPVGRTPAKVVFGFSELKDISYTNGEKDGKCFSQTFFWLGGDGSKKHDKICPAISSCRYGQTLGVSRHR